MFVNPKFELLSSVFHIINKKRFESNAVHFIVCISYFQLYLFGPYWCINANKN